LRYAGAAGLWPYSEIERKYRTYPGNDPSVTLAEAHAQAFNLVEKLRHDQFNKQQHLWVVGSAAADQLIRSVDFWKLKGLSIDFLPYRIYQLGGKTYFEFFAKPYDRHVNPASRKGVFFNTNRAYDYRDSGCLQDMLAKRRVAAYGDRKEAVLCLQTGDYVFYSHNGTGIVGAAIVKGHSVHKAANEEYGEEWFWNVELITPAPTDFSSLPKMTFREVSNLLGQGFFWARIDVRPYLSSAQSESLIKELKSILTPKTTLPETGASEEHLIVGAVPNH
jgi:hypothetical protein